MLDRFINFEPRNTMEGRENTDNKMNFDVNFDGVYIFRIENSKILGGSDKTDDEKLEKYAIKHTEKSKEVIVELKRSKNNIIWQVKNIGKPIPEDEREKIFERFYCIDKSRNRKEKRYGLGLAIAKSTVQRYNGKIEVSYKNGFTIFKVIIPI